MINTAPKISVIVPVYNAGQHFTRCLDTLIHQTLGEIEIILVLDCPTDGSDTTAYRYAETDDRIRIINNSKNLHIGNSRNAGLQIATGEYVCFSDHDDFRELNMFEKLYQLACQNNAELIIGVSHSIDGKSEHSLNLPQLSNPAEVRDFLLTDLIAGGSSLNKLPVATNIHPNLYQRALIENNNIRFVDTRVCTPEDRIFNLQCIFFSSRIYFCYEPLYTHVLHAENFSSNFQYVSSTKRADGRKVVYQFLVQQQIYEQYKTPFLNAVKKEFSNALLSDLILKGIPTFISSYRFIKRISFTKDAFSSGHYSLASYKPTGRISRRILHIILKYF